MPLELRNTLSIFRKEVTKRNEKFLKLLNVLKDLKKITRRDAHKTLKQETCSNFVSEPGTPEKNLHFRHPHRPTCPDTNFEPKSCEFFTRSCMHH